MIEEKHNHCVVKYDNQLCNLWILSYPTDMWIMIQGKYQGVDKNGYIRFYNKSINGVYTKEEHPEYYL